MANKAAPYCRAGYSGVNLYIAVGIIIFVALKDNDYLRNLFKNQA
jgi:hypothetical protein